MTNLDHALAYAARGWRVIPIPPGYKHPKGYDAWQDAATTNTAQITAWWTAKPDHGIGIVTGKGSGLWVLDVDVADGKAGDDTLEELERTFAPLPATYEVITGSGGRHLYFAWGGAEVRNSASGALGPGLDVRGEGGFVVAPPTIHPNGQAYATEVDAPDALATAPAWITALLTKPPVGRPVSVPSRTTNPGGWIDVTPDQGERPGDLWADATDWATILEADGWTLHHEDRQGERHWTRPGKDRRDGTSATTGYGTHDLLKVFTSSMTHLGLAPEQTYSKVGYLAATRHGGDHSAAARHLRDQGWGAPTLAPAIARPGALAPVIIDAQGHEIDPWLADEPIPVGRDAPLPPPPVDDFPDWIAAQITNVATQIGCDPMLPTVFALGALSVAGLGHIQINVRAGQIERSTGLYLAATGPPSSGKSPALEMMMEPVREHERRTITMATRAVADAQRTKSVAEKQAKEAADNAARTGEPERLKTALDLGAKADAITVPPSGELITSDITPERLATIMAENRERMAIVSDESGVFDLDRYGDKGAGRKIDIYLQGFTGQDAIVHRQNAPDVRLRRPLLAMVVGVQPAALARVMADRELRDRGLTARFLTASTTIVATNTDIDRDVWDHPVGDTYTQRLSDLATRWAALGAHHPITIDLTLEGRQTFSGWADELRDREISGDLVGEGGWVSKMRQSTLRIAALFHLADGAEHATPVPAQTVLRAIEIGEWFIAHHLHSVSVSQGSDAERMLEWLRKYLERNMDADQAKTTEGDEKGGSGAVSRATSLFVSRRELGRSGPVGMRKIEDCAPVLEELDEAGWIRLVGVTAGNQQFSAQLRRAARIEVHPSLMARDTSRQTRQMADLDPVSDDTRAAEHNEMYQGAGNVAESRVSLYKGLSRPSLSVVFPASQEVPATPAILRREVHDDVSHAEAPPDPQPPSADLLADLEELL